MAIKQEGDKLAHLADMEVEVTVELGRKMITLAAADLAKVGDVFEMDRLAGEPFDVLINGALFAHGEIVVLSEIMACRLTQLEEPVEASKEVLV